MSSQPVIDKVKAQSEKKKGNEAFQKQQWITAIGHYTSAQVADPTEFTIPLNRAMAYIKIHKYVDAERDCTTSLKLEPTCVKAVFRRATARVGADKFEDAKADFKQVLVLDPANQEAKAELVKLKERIEKQQNQKNRQPIDLAKLAADSSVSTLETVPNLASPRATSESQDVSGGHSSVEAARKFLEKVGMNNPAVETSERKENETFLRPLPVKLPGETGGLLREVSSKRVSPGLKDSSNKGFAPTETIQRDQAAATLRPALSHQVTATRTASALNFGQTTASAPARVASIPSRHQTTRHTLTAFEFQRRWKETSRISPFQSAQEDKVATAVENQLELLQSIEPATIPKMMDSLLEPDLLGEVVTSLANGLKSCEPREGTRALAPLVREWLTFMPRCKRFSMTAAMLDTTEKEQIRYLIEHSQNADTKSLKRVWEV